MPIPFHRFLHIARMRLRSLFRGRSLDAELNEELQYHLEQLVDANIARGLSPNVALREARLAIGGIESRKEQCRDTRRVRGLANLVQDVRYAARTLVRAPSFAIAALLTLTLGIGASVAMFTVVNGVLLRSLPFPQPDRLFLVAMSPRSPFIRQPVLSDHNYLAFRDHDRTFNHLATFSIHPATVLGAGEPAVVPVASVTADFFPALNVAPAVGRVFAGDRGQTIAERTIVLSERLWRSRLGGDPGALGRQLTVDGLQYEIVGVMPAGFDFPAKAQAWIPRVIKLDPGNSLMFPVFGRLRDGVTVAEARAQFGALMPELPQQPDGSRAEWQIGLFPLKELLVGDIRRPLEIFAGAVVFVLLIACANVANLLLARASDRRRELGIRAALGATRRPLVCQVLTESTFLALLGGAAGIAIAQWIVPALLALAPQGRIPRLESIRLDRSVSAFALCASLATGILFGLPTAMRVTHRRSTESLSPGARTFGAGQERLRAALAVSEIALALILLTGAGLMLKSFLRLRAVEPGFNTSNVISLNLELPAKVYSTLESLRGFQHDLLGRLNNMPNAIAAGSVNWRPLGDMHLNGDFRIEGRPQEPDFNVTKPAVSPGYFRAMGITLVRGRDFGASDAASGQPVAIVSRTVAKFIDPAEDVIGKRVSLESTPRAEDWLTVVGVVEDVRQMGPTQSLHPAIYQPYGQVRKPFFLRHLSFLVRTASDPVGAVPGIRAALRAADGNQPATSIVLMDDILAAATAEPRFQTRLLASFAVLAIVLALVGTYGVLAYSVAQRTHEIGVRVALGAGIHSVVWMVIRRTAALAFTGVAIGTIGAWIVTRLLTTFLFETTPTDPVTFATVALSVFVAAVCAGLIPAYRATQVDPIVALRHE